MATRTTTKQSRQTSTTAAPTGWNWGAFWLTWIWGIGNRVWISFLALIPFVGLVMPFVLGAKGTQWAWEARESKQLEEFKKTQRTWALIGWIVGALSILFVIIMILLTVFVFKATAAPVDASREFVSDLQGNRIDEAYEESSQLFKTVTTKEKLQSVATTQQKVSSGEFSVQSRKIENSTATVEGTLKGSGGGDISVKVRLVKDGDRWLVQGYNIN